MLVLVLFLLVLVVMVVVVKAGKYDHSINDFNIRDVIDVVRGFFNGTAADTEWKLFVV